jgi:LysR family transcriptional regulator, hca operon transcriptional activator
MELRHIRYFVAVAEEGSLTVAAERRLHTSQPSLSRQIRDLELEVGVPLLTRSVHGVELTAAGKAFLDHARLVLTQVEAAREAARRAAHPEKPGFALGFLTGQEMDWLPEAMHILRDELPHIDVSVSSEYSPVLADALTRGRLDLAFMRREANAPDLLFRTVLQETLMAVLPSDHPLAPRDSIELREIADEPFVTVSDTAPALRAVSTITSGKAELRSRPRMRRTISRWRFHWLPRGADLRCCRATRRTSCPGRWSAVRSRGRRRTSTSWSAITRRMRRRC